jgi:hypothetical protein
LLGGRRRGGGDLTRRGLTRRGLPFVAGTLFALGGDPILLLLARQFDRALTGAAFVLGQPV